MKKSVKLAVAAVLIGASLSAGAWWGGPYGAPPYWGGYAPLYGPPVAPAYGYGLTQEQLNEWAARQQEAVEQRAQVGYAPWGYGPSAPWGAGPSFGEPGDFSNGPAMAPNTEEMFRQFQVTREQALKASEARRAAFRARVVAQRAAMEARRAAWREAVGTYPQVVAPPATDEPADAPEQAAAEPELKPESEKTQ